MKISYVRENTNEAPLITAMLSVAALAVLLVYYDFSMNIITALAVVILLSLFVLAGFLLSKHDNKRFIEHRDALCEEGIACEGKIIGMSHKKSRFGADVHAFIIEYHSKILDKTIQFTTPAVEQNFENKANLTCTVYESSDSKFRKIHHETEANRDLDANLDYAICYIADTLDNTHENKKYTSDILAPILVIVGAILCISLLYDIYQEYKPLEQVSIPLEDYFTADFPENPHK